MRLKRLSLPTACSIRARAARMGEREQSAFARRIGFGVGLRHQCAGRGDGYDRATGFTQRLFRGASQEKCCGPIGVEDAMPFRERQSAERVADYDAGRSIKESIA